VEVTDSLPKGDQDGELPTGLVVAVRWVRGASMAGSLYVFGVLLGFRGFSREWFYGSLVVTPVINTVNTMASTLLGMGALLLLARPGTRTKLGRRFLKPLLTMAGMVAGVGAALALLALLVFGMVRLYQWTAHERGADLLGAVIISAVASYVAIFVVAEIALLTAAMIGWCLQSWFGAAEAHRLLPAMATLVFGVAQIGAGILGFVSGRIEADTLTGVILAIVLGGPACLTALAIVELRLRLRGTIARTAYSRRVRASGDEAHTA
jgi:hypothetical protein